MLSLISSAAQNKGTAQSLSDTPASHTISCFGSNSSVSIYHRLGQSLTNRGAIPKRTYVVPRIKAALPTTGYPWRLVVVRLKARTRRLSITQATTIQAITLLGLTNNKRISKIAGGGIAFGRLSMTLVYPSIHPHTHYRLAVAHPSIHPSLHPSLPPPSLAFHQRLGSAVQSRPTFCLSAAIRCRLFLAHPRSNSQLDPA